MKKILLPLLCALLCVLSCKKNDAAGTAGIRVDAQGNLVINAPVYVATGGMEYGEMRQADKSLVDTIEALISNGEDQHAIATGTISGGRITITIPIPDEQYLVTADSLFDSRGLQSGGGVRIAPIDLSGANSYILLIDNPQAEQDGSKDYLDYGIEKGRYTFLYSEGDVVISDNDSYIAMDDYYGMFMGIEIFDISLTKGWNTICYSSTNVGDESLANIMNSRISKEPPPDAVWVLYQEADNLVNSGWEYLNMEEYDIAIENFNEAIRIDPNHAEAYQYRGAAYAKMEDWDTAIENYNEAIKFDPGYALAYYNRGIAYSEKGEWDAAIENFDKAIRFDPDYLQTYSIRGWIYLQKKEYDRAITDFDHVIQLDPGYVSAYNYRGYANYLKCNYEQAAADFEAVLRIDPDNDYAKKNLNHAIFELSW